MTPEEELRDVMALVTAACQATTQEEQLMLRGLVAVRVGAAVGLSPEQSMAALRPRLRLHVGGRTC